MQVPYARRHVISDAERAIWEKVRMQIGHQADMAFRAEETLDMIRARGVEGMNYFK